MKKFAIFAGVLMVLGCFASLGVALDPLDKSDAKADQDQDGLENWEEYSYGTDPNDPDSDGAGTYDGWEIWYENHRAVDLDTGAYLISDSYHFDPNYALDEGVVANPSQLIQVRDGDASVTINDPDNDGWNNLHEALVGTDPTNPDTDNDGLTDSMDPDPLVSGNTGTGGGGNGGGGSGMGEGMAAGEA